MGCYRYFRRCSLLRCVLLVFLVNKKQSGFFKSFFEEKGLKEFPVIYSQGPFLTGRFGGVAVISWLNIF